MRVVFTVPKRVTRAWRVTLCLLRSARDVGCAGGSLLAAAGAKWVRPICRRHASVSFENTACDQVPQHRWELFLTPRRQERGVPCERTHAHERIFGSKCACIVVENHSVRVQCLFVANPAIPHWKTLPTQRPDPTLSRRHGQVAALVLLHAAPATGASRPRARSLSDMATGCPLTETCSESSRASRAPDDALIQPRACVGRVSGIANTFSTHNAHSRLCASLLSRLPCCGSAAVCARFTGHKQRGGQANSVRCVSTPTACASALATPSLPPPFPPSLLPSLTPSLTSLTHRESRDNLRVQLSMGSASSSVASSVAERGEGLRAGTRDRAGTRRCTGRCTIAGTHKSI